MSGVKMDAGRPRIFVGLFGLNRSLRWTLKSIRRNIFAPLARAGVDVVAAAHFNMPPVIHNIHSGETGVRHTNAGWPGLDVSALLMEDQSAETIPAEIRPWMGEVLSDDTPKIAQTRANLIYQLHSLRRLWILAGLLDRDRFDAFLLIRPDMEYLDPLDIDHVLDRIVGHGVDLITPSWSEWSGLNDRFAFCSPRGAAVYADRLFAVDGFCRRHGWLQAESLLKDVAEAAELKRETTPMRALRVRANGATWREPFPMTPYQHLRALARKRLVRAGLPSLP
ncbi:hypothetical protein Q4F19_00840 [Sphingomonas sp. BIUV-7]|uniref:Uncharacterized protein n=1 Tax=Sphingomonas natans TaxID=3063330 RepID=A0ABT8Y4T4_9SPHN|nr:hypothetical protein [Sphingomonas sp. BIUV-7]MDO6412918.1 hypothetical protein [Sphingomonas sp. BIUV-7]